MSFDTFLNLPAHPLLVHVPVVCIPLAAIGAVAIGGRLAQSQVELRACKGERDRYHAELETLTALFSDEDGPAPENLAFAPAPELEAAVDPASGLLDQQFFRVLVQQRVAAARRHLQPVAVIIFDIDDVDEALHLSARGAAVIGDAAAVGRPAAEPRWRHPRRGAR